LRRQFIAGMTLTPHKSQIHCTGNGNGNGLLFHMTQVSYNPLCETVM